jgi:hypothetical protein
MTKPRKHGRPASGFGSGGARRVTGRAPRDRWSRRVIPPDEEAADGARPGRGAHASPRVRGPRTPAGPADSEHDQRDRERAPAAAEDHHDAQALPDRRGGAEAVVPGVTPHADTLGDGPPVDRRPPHFAVLFGDRFVPETQRPHTQNFRHSAVGLSPLGCRRWAVAVGRRRFSSFGTSRRSGLRAVRNLAPFGTSRRSGLRAVYAFRRLAGGNLLISSLDFLPSRSAER